MNSSTLQKSGMKYISIKEEKRNGRKSVYNTKEICIQKVCGSSFLYFLNLFIENSFQTTALTKCLKLVIFNLSYR